jgi:NTE family protein
MRKTDQSNYKKIINTEKLIFEDKKISFEKSKGYPHRALILQGGGALGAYEVGVIKALTERLIQEDIEKAEDRPLFNIIAGSSIGAVNAAIIVNYVTKRRRQGLSVSESWNGVDQILYDFWDDLSTPFWWIPRYIRNSNIHFEILPSIWNIILSSNYDVTWGIGRAFRDLWISIPAEFIKLSMSQFQDFFKIWWPIPTIPYFDEGNPPYLIKFAHLTDKWREYRPYSSAFFWWPDNIGELASGETARRYHSYLVGSIFGDPNVLAPVIYQPDWKFLNPFNNFARYATPIENLLSSSHYWLDNKRSPLMTSPGDGEPRLLLISVDVQDCTTAVTFDSFAKEKEFRKCATIYGGDNIKYTAEYDGITPEHVTTSMSFHQIYKYLHFPVTKEAKEDNEKQPKIVEERYFWDGAYLSNTPLREVVQHHRDYWHKKRKEKQVPDLEVYIVNLYPSTEKSIENVIMDSDLIQDRDMDIKFHDRTNYDLKISELTSDYIDLITLLIKRSLEHAAKRDLLAEEFTNIFKIPFTRSKKRSGKVRTFSDLIDGRFRITRTCKVERVDDGNTIFGKAFEFSHTTVNYLREKGYEEGQNTVFKETEK